MASLTALRKPDGGVRGIATGDVFRRLVSKALATEWADKFDQATRPFQFALQARADRCPRNPRVCRPRDTQRRRAGVAGRPMRLRQHVAGGLPRQTPRGGTRVAPVQLLLVGLRWPLPGCSSGRRVRARGRPRSRTLRSDSTMLFNRRQRRYTPRRQPRRVLGRPLRCQPSRARAAFSHQPGQDSSDRCRSKPSSAWDCGTGR